MNQGKAFIQMVDEDDAIHRRIARDQQQRVIAAYIGAGHRAGGKPATPVRLEPFQPERAFKVLTVFRLDIHQHLYVRRFGPLYNSESLPPSSSLMAAPLPF